MPDGTTMVDLGEQVASYGRNSLVSAHHVELGEPGDGLLEEHYVEPEEQGKPLISGILC